MFWFRESLVIEGSTGVASRIAEGKAIAEIINSWVTTARGLVVFSILQSAMDLVGKGESRFGVSCGWYCPLICEGNVCTQVFVALGSHCRGYTARMSGLLLT